MTKGQARSVGSLGAQGAARLEYARVPRSSAIYVQVCVQGLGEGGGEAG